MSKVLTQACGCRVKEHCIQRGLSWDDSLANTSCQEQEYYEDLLRYYRYNYRVSSEPEWQCFNDLVFWTFALCLASHHGFLT